MTSLPSSADVRAFFPSLSSGLVFLENAGGSQVPRSVAEAVREYMLTTYVQLGAGYPLSSRATAVVDEAHAFVETLVGAGSSGKVVLGPSTTALVTILANAYAQEFRPGDEVIVAEVNHEANAGPWVRLERSAGARVHFWRIDPGTVRASLEDLALLLSDRTRIVALAHVSNLLGDVEDIKAAVSLIRERAPRARVVVDGVAYAPHRPIDVADLGVDWYVYSTYKVYGPHLAALFGRHEAFEELEGPNHFFVPRSSIPYKFELGGVSHEACAGLLGLRPYLTFLAGGGECDRAAVVRAFEVMAALEAPLVARLLDSLSEISDLRIVGSPRAGADRVGTVSFLHERVPSPAITRAVQEAGFAIRSGHMYAIRLCNALGIDPETGVARISLVHYNTMNEIERLVDAIKFVLGRHAKPI
jgi:cysteine desulfurase family protein (TIGR01976 family)